MKQFGSLLLAAVLGSVITLAATEWLGDDNENAGISYLNGVPTSKVAYTVNEKGEAVPLDFTGVAERVTPAVVHIRSTSSGDRSSTQQPDPWQFFFGPNTPMQRRPSQSTGSGVIINADGYVVTNNHVVDNADEVEVTLFNNKSFRAEVIGTDPDTDLALLKINQKNLPFLSFVDSDKARVGEWVLAVGNPFNLNSTVTAGIISAKGRNINIINSSNPPDAQGRTAIESFIQTDAAINPGNSGGALIDLSGGLLGINTAIASTTGAYAGYGFAVPSDIVSKVVEDLMKYGTVQRGWLGISVQNVNSDLVREHDLAESEGAYVAGFSEDPVSAAKEAGVKEGDVVVKLDETQIRTSTALIEYIGRKRPGDEVRVTVNRKGKTVEIPVTLKNREGKEVRITRAEMDPVMALGLNLEDLDERTLRRLELDNGVRVASLAQGKIDRYTDMQEGFIITRVDDIPVKTAKQVNDLLKKKKSGDLVTFSGVYEDYSREYIYAIRM